MENSLPIIDSALTLEESLNGLEIPAEIRETLVLVDVRYVSFDGLLHQGQLVLHKAVAKEVQEIFKGLYALQFPITHVLPIVKYAWNDEASMQDNNSSAFNYRVIYGTNELSNHSYGLAIDINPKINPYITRTGTRLPSGATYDPAQPGALIAGSDAVTLFTSRGWTWGGDWNFENGQKDWQHFDKKI